MPESARGWLCWSVNMLEHFARPRSVRYEPGPRLDPRLDDRRETALSVLRILEKVSGGNGAGKLLIDFYGSEMSWYSFSKKEQWLIEKTHKAFARALREAGFLPGPDVDRSL